MDPVVGSTSANKPEGASDVEVVRAQLVADESLNRGPLVDVLLHAQAIRAAADFRILHAASLIFDDCTSEYMAHVAETVEKDLGPVETVDDLALSERINSQAWSPEEEFGPNGMQRAIAEVGAALTVDTATAGQLISAGDQLRYRFPKTGALLATGRIDLTRFLLIVQRTKLVAEKAPELDSALAAEIEQRAPMSRSRFRALIDHVIAKVDPDALIRAREAAQADRSSTSYLMIGPQVRHGWLANSLPVMVPR